VWHGLDVRPGALGRHGVAERVAVVGAIGHEDLARAETAQQVGGTPAVVRLSLAQLERDRKAIGVDEGVDLGCQPSSRTPHALGSSVVPSGGWRGVRTPFLTLLPDRRGIDHLQVAVIGRRHGC
jgi:hypothetical protein